MASQIFEQLQPIFSPRSAAVIGASGDVRKWGGQMVQRMLLAKYPGPLYPINPKESEIQGLRAYRSILDVPGDIDVAAIAIHAEQVPGALRECIQKKVKGVAIISADFAETGNFGKALQEEIVSIARQGNMRIIGPNCQGMSNSASSLNFASQTVPVKGPVAIISQSGSLAGEFVNIANTRGYGLSKVISMGNQADLDVADYIEYLADDPDTRAIFIYLEGFRDGRKLFHAAREATRKKPIVVFKAAKNKAVARVAMSHTAATAGEDRVFDAMCKQAGLIRSDDLFGSLGMASALTRQPLPRGNRMGIMGLGGLCVTTSDTCVSLGMEVPQMTEKDMNFVLDGIDFPPHAPPPRNPVDFAGGARTALIEARVLNRLAQLDYIDGIVSMAPMSRAQTLGSDPKADEITSQIREYLSDIPLKYGKPVVLMGLSGFVKRSGELMNSVLGKAAIPVYPSPEEAVRAMSALVKYGQIKRRIED